MYNLVWQSVMCRPGKLLILLVMKNQMLEPNRSDRQTASAPWGKRAAGGSLTTVGLRPPFVSLPPAPFSSYLSLASHLDCRLAPPEGSALLSRIVLGKLGTVH